MKRNARRAGGLDRRAEQQYPGVLTNLQGLHHHPVDHARGECVVCLEQPVELDCRQRDDAELGTLVGREVTCELELRVEQLNSVFRRHVCPSHCDMRFARRGRGNMAVMNDQELAVGAQAREQRARDREARTLAHERVAALRAKEATSRESAENHRLEAETHRIAAELHHGAIEIQAWHAQHHEY